MAVFQLPTHAAAPLPCGVASTPDPTSMARMQAASQEPASQGCRIAAYVWGLAVSSSRSPSSRSRHCLTLCCCRCRGKPGSGAATGVQPVQPAAAAAGCPRPAHPGPGAADRCDAQLSAGCSAAAAPRRAGGCFAKPDSDALPSILRAAGEPGLGVPRLAV